MTAKPSTMAKAKCKMHLLPIFFRLVLFIYIFFPDKIGRENTRIRSKQTTTVTTSFDLSAVAAAGHQAAVSRIK